MALLLFIVYWLCSILAPINGISTMVVYITTQFQTTFLCFLFFITEVLE